jgi:Tol biopolymer transport system component
VFAVRAGFGCIHAGGERRAGSRVDTRWVFRAWRVGAVLVVVGLALPAGASGAPEHAEVAFVSGGSIFAARADGSERRALASPRQPGEQLAYPVWSPDGTTLVYVSAVAQGGDPETGPDAARLMIFDGVVSRPLTALRDGVYDTSPTWSPDGSMLAFARTTEARNRFRSTIVTMSLATGAERTLAAVHLGARFRSVGEPAWSPDGSTIAYTQARLDSEYHFRPLIRVVPSAGGEPRTVIRDAQSASWSPDGGRLAFASVRDRNGRRCGSDECWYAGELYTARADGSDARRLTFNEGDDARPTWSPDGSRLLFTSDRNLPERDSSEVYSIASEGSCLTWLTNGTPSSGQPAWRPGTGTRYDPGSCDPGSRPALIDTPRLPRVRDGLWLGARFDGLLLSDIQRSGRDRYLAYDDCEHFDPRRCPQTVLLVIEPACKTFTFRGITENAYRLRRRRGALLAFAGGEADGILFSGHTVTSIQLGTRNRLADVHRVVRGLRPLDHRRPVRRLAPPRVPRGLARRLDRTARTLRRHGTVKQTARALRTSRLDIRGRLRLRRALLAHGPYRYSACRHAD